MDCMDCHNRPAHTFDSSPGRAVDTAIAVGKIAGIRRLPGARRWRRCRPRTESRDAAMTGIARALREAYKGEASSSPALAGLIAGVQGVYARNVFPAMKVGWGTYPNNIGHMAFPGCFRCHDDTHKAPDGRAIQQDRQACHDMP